MVLAQGSKVTIRIITETCSNTHRSRFAEQTVQQQGFSLFSIEHYSTTLKFANADGCFREKEKRTLEEGKGKWSTYCR